MFKIIKFSLAGLIISYSQGIYAADVSWNISANTSNSSKVMKRDNIDFTSDKAWHLKRINFWKSIYLSRDIIRPTVKTAFLDGGISKHEDLYYTNKSSKKRYADSSHGDMTMGAAFALIGNKKGSRGIANPSFPPEFYYLGDNDIKLRGRLQNIFNTASSKEFKIINLSYYFDADYGMAHLTTQCGLEKKRKVKYSEINHLKNIKYFRTVLKHFSKNLFIVSAGNSYRCSDKIEGEVSKNITDNGAIHYELIEKNGKTEIKYSPLDNVIVVGALKKGDTIQSYSFRGQPVDILAPASLFTTPKGKGKYGEGRGTSVAAPVVTGVAAALAYNTNLHDPKKLKDVLLNGASEKISKIPVLNMESSKTYADENYPMK